MKIYIFADIEGCSGVYAREQVLPVEGRFSEGRACMTADVNACAQGCKEGGADVVVVRDGHGGSYSLNWDQLSEDIDEAICGYTSDDRFSGLADADGVILLGYHAMAGTAGGVLEHSMFSVSIQNYWINGCKAGEVAIDAGIVGEHGKPVIMVSGDDKVCLEAKALLPWIETAQVKRGLSTFGAALLPPKKAHDIIRESAKAAVARIADMKPLVYASPVKFRVELTERNRLPHTIHREDITIIDGRTYEVTADSMEKALFASL
ncbi:MAG: M55 family metallopeptidase [Clostridia bacterium]|nr:M55 family metallopeptidase [Clostridia bacterium]